MTVNNPYTWGLGRRKSSVARVRIRSGSGNFLVNKNYRGHILEIVSAASGKWPALHKIMLERGIDAQEILAIGDDTNDAEMIRAAGVGVAMGNAQASVKDAADYVARSNGEDGVVEAIERFILC